MNSNKTMNPLQILKVALSKRLTNSNHEFIINQMYTISSWRIKKFIPDSVSEERLEKDVVEVTLDEGKYLLPQRYATKVLEHYAVGSKTTTTHDQDQIRTEDGIQFTAKMKFRRYESYTFENKEVRSAVWDFVDPSNIREAETSNRVTRSPDMFSQCGQNMMMDSQYDDDDDDAILCSAAQAAEIAAGKPPKEAIIPDRIAFSFFGSTSKEAEDRIVQKKRKLEDKYLNLNKDDVVELD